MVFSLCSCGLVIFGKAASVTTQATYLGVKDYGLDTTNRDTMDDFLYRFDVDGTESVYKVSNGTKDEEGNFDSPIQNVLKEWYERYPIYLCAPEKYFWVEGENAGRFTWDTQEGKGILTDPEGIRDKSPEDVLKILFDESSEQADASTSDERVILGNERFDEYLPLLENKKVALFTNQTGIIGNLEDGEHILDALLAKDVDVTAVFCP